MKFDARGGARCSGVLFGNRDDQPQFRDLLEGEKRGIRAGSDQGAGMDQAIGDDAVEGRGDSQIGLHFLERSEIGGGRPAGWRRDRMRAARRDLLLHLHQFVSGDGAGSFRRFLGAISASRAASCASACRRSDSRLAPWIPPRQFAPPFQGRSIRRELPCFTTLPAIHEDLFYVTGHPGVKGDA